MEVWEEENEVVNMERDKKYMYMIKIMRKELSLLKYFQGKWKKMSTCNWSQCFVVHQASIWILT